MLLTKLRKRNNKGLASAIVAAFVMSFMPVAPVQAQSITTSLNLVVVYPDARTTQQTIDTGFSYSVDVLQNTACYLEVRFADDNNLFLSKFLNADDTVSGSTSGTAKLLEITSDDVANFKINVDSETGQVKVFDKTGKGNLTVVKQGQEVGKITSQNSTLTLSDPVLTADADGNTTAAPETFTVTQTEVVDGKTIETLVTYKREQNDDGEFQVSLQTVQKREVDEQGNVVATGDEVTFDSTATDPPGETFNQAICNSDGQNCNT